MARIIGGIAASHTPTIGFAYDRNKRDDPAWAPIFDNFAPLAAWLAEKRPDVLLLTYNDPESSFEAAGLSEEERVLIRRRDWRGLMHYGAIFFVLEKLGAVTGVSNLHIYAAMRGESLEAFQRTRNAPGALYSVAGKDAA
jgi:hypothetical protein